jgi:hypothetical protein
VIGKLIAWALGGVVVYEGGKLAYGKWFHEVAMIKGHTYSLALNYTHDPMSPISQATAQGVLDSQSPGHFNVLSAAMTPGVQSGIRQIALSVELVAPSADFPASTFTTGWPVAMGRISLASSQDMGGPAGVA